MGFYLYSQSNCYVDTFDYPPFIFSENKSQYLSTFSAK